MMLIEQQVIDMLINQNGFINVVQTKHKPALKFTITEAAAEGLRILRQNVNAQSALTYTTAVNSFTAWLRVAHLNDKPFTYFSNADAKKYLLWVKEQGVSNMTHNSYKRLLHAVFKYFNELHGHGVNIFDNIKDKKVEHSANLPYNEEQKKIILPWLKVHHFGLYCMATFLYYLAPRINELVLMRVRDLRSLQGFALIPGSSSKTDNTRRPELSLHFLDFLKRTF
jgi:site-specific recombinase XerD